MAVMRLHLIAHWWHVQLHTAFTFSFVIYPGSDASEEQPHDKVESQSVPSAAAVKQDLLQPEEGVVKTDDGKADEGETETSKYLKNNLPEDKELEVMDTQEEGAQTEGK